MDISSGKSSESTKSLHGNESMNSLRIKNLKVGSASKNNGQSNPINFLKQPITFTNSTTMDLWRRSTFGDEINLSTSHLQINLELDSSIISELYNKISLKSFKNEIHEKNKEKNHVLENEESHGVIETLSTYDNYKILGDIEESTSSSIKLKLFCISNNSKETRNCIRISCFQTEKGIEKANISIQELHKVCSELLSSISKINSPYNPPKMTSYSKNYIYSNISEFVELICFYELDHKNEAITFKILEIFPFVTFKLIQISNFPILLTEYSKLLLSKQNSTRNIKESFGYVTLNLDQKAMLVSPNAKYSKDCSLVGIWVYFNFNFTKEMTNEQKAKILNHQLVISGILRFLFSTEFRVKASPSMDKSTYLLILISEQTLATNFFEFKINYSENKANLENKWIVKERLLSASKDSNDEFNTIKTSLRIGRLDEVKSNNLPINSFANYFAISEFNIVKSDPSNINKSKDFQVIRNLKFSKIEDSGNSREFRERKTISISGKDQPFKFIGKGKNSMIEPQRNSSQQNINQEGNSKIFYPSNQVNKHSMILKENRSNRKYEFESNKELNFPQVIQSRNLSINSLQPTTIELCPTSTKSKKFKKRNGKKGNEEDLIYKSISSPNSKLGFQIQNSKMENMCKRILFLEKAMKEMVIERTANCCPNCSKAVGNLNELIKNLTASIVEENNSRIIDKGNLDSNSPKPNEEAENQINCNSISSIKLEETNQEEDSKLMESHFMIRKLVTSTQSNIFSPKRLSNSNNENKNQGSSEHFYKPETKVKKVKLSTKNQENGKKNIYSKFVNKEKENNPNLINQPNDRIRSLSNQSKEVNSQIGDSIINCSKVTKATEKTIENKPIYKLMDLVTKNRSDWSFQVPKIVFNEETESSQITLNSILE